MAKTSRTVLTSAAALTMVASTLVGGAAASQAAPQPRINPSQCAFDAPTNGYVIVDPSTNTKCVTNANGTFMWVNGAVIRRNQQVCLRASFKVIRRGDVRSYARFRFVRGNKVIVKRVRVNASQRCAICEKLRKRGTWAVTSTFQGRRVTATVKVV